MNKDIIEMRKMFEQLKEIRNRINHMKPSHREEYKLHNVKNALRKTEYYFEDLMNNMENREHWATIKKFQKEKFIL